MTWLVTGGAGYIGSHVVVAACEANIPVVVVDNLSTGYPKRLPNDIPFLKANISDNSLKDFIQTHGVTGVVHLAAMKQVGQSVTMPLEYWENNVGQLLTFCSNLLEVGVLNHVFSSSAAVYGTSESSLISESDPTLPINTYGRTKLAGELLFDSLSSLEDFSCMSLRYFNVAGAGNSVLRDTQLMNLIPIALDKVQKRLPLEIFGSEYPTPDGTCVRDFVHVEDIATAHIAAMRHVSKNKCLNEKINLGSGSGTSVKEVLEQVASITGHSRHFETFGMRDGDPPFLVADVSKAHEVLNWHATRGLEAIIKSSL